MKKLVISGGPHTGKTTLHEELRSVYPAFHYVPEPATTVLRRLSDGGQDYWRDVIGSAADFCQMCIDQSLTNERSRQASIT